MTDRRPSARQEKIDISKPRRNILGAILNHAAKNISYPGLESMDPYPFPKFRCVDHLQWRAK
jgi:hypothetical protein